MDSPDDVGAQPPGTRMSWVERVPQGVVKPLFGRVAWAFYIAAALTAVLLLVLLLVLRPDLRPIFDDIWFLTDPIWSVFAVLSYQRSSPQVTSAGTGWPVGLSGCRPGSG